MFFGKLIAGGLGFLMTQSFVGLIIGVIVGHLFDRGLGQAFAVGSPANVARIKQSFFETTFLLLGHLAKVDGYGGGDLSLCSHYIFIYLILHLFWLMVFFRLRGIYRVKWSSVPPKFLLR